MRDPLPESIDPRRQLGTSGQLVGIWPAARCQRVFTAVERLLSDVSVEISLTDVENGIKLDGHISVTLELVCQRCLQPVQWTLDEQLKLLLVRSGSEVVAEAGYELLDLDEHGQIDTAQWIEDEIILRIPNVLMHSRTQECDPDIIRRAREYETLAESGASEKDNPFKVLKDWKGSGE